MALHAGDAALAARRDFCVENKRNGNQKMKNLSENGKCDNDKLGSDYE